MFVKAIANIRDRFFDSQCVEILNIIIAMTDEIWEETKGMGKFITHITYYRHAKQTNTQYHCHLSK